MKWQTLPINRSLRGITLRTYWDFSHLISSNKHKAKNRKYKCLISLNRQLLKVELLWLSNHFYKWIFRLKTAIKLPLLPIIKKMLSLMVREQYSLLGKIFQVKQINNRRIRCLMRRESKLKECIRHLKMW